MPTTTIISIPPIKVDCRFILEEKRHLSLPTSNRYTENIDKINLTKSDYPLWSLDYERSGSVPGGRIAFGPRSSYRPISLSTASIRATIPQDLIDDINNDRTQTYSKTVTDGLSFTSQDMYITNLLYLMTYFWTMKRRTGNDTSGAVLLTTSGSFPIGGDTADVTIHYRPMTSGNTFYYCFSYEFDYTMSIACQINGKQ